MSPKMLSDAIHREIKMNIGVCEVYLALEAMRHNNAIYVYCMCYDETKEVWQVSNVSRSLSLDRQKKHFWWLYANNWWKWRMIIAIFQFKQLERRSLKKKIGASTGFEPLNFRVAGALFYQLSYEATHWLSTELITLTEYNTRKRLKN